jgi:hypothetical protein
MHSEVLGHIRVEGLMELTVEHPKLLQHPDYTITLHYIPYNRLLYLQGPVSFCDANHD